MCNTALQEYLRRKIQNVMKESYATLSTAIQSLQQKGYTTDFNFVLKNDDQNLMQQWKNGELEVTKIFRFEGMSNPGDDAILYVIEGKNNVRGLLIDNYSGTEDQVPVALLRKLKITYDE